MENNKDYIDEKDKKEEHDLNETNSIESNSLDNTSSVNITNEKEGMELIESNIPEVKKLDIEEVNLCKCQCSHNKEQKIETTLAVDSKEDSYEEEEIQNNIKTMDENKNKKNITSFIIILCFLAVISFFISRELINISKEEQSSAIINQVESITRDVVEIREVERGKVMNAKEIFANSVDSVVGIQTETNQNVFGQIVNSATSGTGFIISKDGYIVTNYHVIENAHKITVNLYDGKEYDARLVGTEEESDLAVLKIDSEDLKPVVIGDSDSIIVGEDIYTIGHPLGQLTYTITDGIVSAKDRLIALDPFMSLNMFQTNTAMNNGNSGGPIFNAYGEVIGIATAKYSSEHIEGIGFGIPINDVIDMIQQIIENGRVVDKTYLGITVTSILEEEARQKNIPQGAYISEIVKDSCSEKAGLKHGDIIVQVDDIKITTNTELINAKKKYRAGDTAMFKVWRSGEFLDIELTFDRYTEEAEASVKKFQEEQMKEIEEQYKNFNFGN